MDIGGGMIVERFKLFRGQGSTYRVMIHVRGVSMTVLLGRGGQKRLLRSLCSLDRLCRLSLSRLRGLEQLLRLHRAQKLLAGRAVAQKVR